MSAAKTHVQEFDPARVRPLPDQPRKRLRGIRELADSIVEAGQLSAGIVSLVDDDPDFDAQLIDGERRLQHNNDDKPTGGKMRQIHTVVKCSEHDMNSPKVGSTSLHLRVL